MKRKTKPQEAEKARRGKRRHKAAVAFYPMRHKPTLGNPAPPVTPSQRDVGDKAVVFQGLEAEKAGVAEGQRSILGKGKKGKNTINKSPPKPHSPTPF